MLKDFDSWNKMKKQIDGKTDIPFFKEGDVWWVQLGLNIGFEINGKGDYFMRPVLIVKKYNQFTFLAIPLSTAMKVNAYRHSVGVVDGKPATANLSQLRNIDSKRLVNKVGHLDQEQLKAIKEKTSRINFG